MLQTRSHQGFTLLELLVAIAIFTIVAAMAMGGFHQLVKQREQATDAMQRIRMVQRCVMRISQDFEQLSPRPIRDATSNADIPALNASTDGANIIELSHGGWFNPTGINRSTLQRVRYRLIDNKLYREYWPMLDRNLNTNPVQTQLLDKVTSVTLRYMSESREWQTSWPPNLSTGAPASNMGRMLPVAIEITITLQDWGDIKRVIEVPTL